jgi:hypothetical protein
MVWGLRQDIERVWNMFRDPTKGITIFENLWLNFPCRVKIYGV